MNIRGDRRAIFIEIAWFSFNNKCQNKKHFSRAMRDTKRCDEKYIVFSGFIFYMDFNISMYCLYVYICTLYKHYYDGSK